MTATMTRPTTPPRRHRLAKVLLTIAALAVLVVGVVIYFDVTADPATTTPTPARPAAGAVIPPVTSVAVPSGDAGADGLAAVDPAVPAPDGCLGGPDPHTAVLFAQQSAPLTDTGAAEFALAVTRWFMTPPITNPEAADAFAVDPDGLRNDLATISLRWEGVNATFALVDPQGFGYRVVSNDGTTATVTVGVDQRYTPALGQPSTTTVFDDIQLVAKDGHWMYLGGSAPTTEIAALLPFFGACA